MLDESNNSKIRKRPNATFRAKQKQGVGERMEVDLDADSPKIRALRQAERRKKGFRWAAMLVMAISLCALGRTALNETLFRNPRFILREIKVTTKGMLTEQQIQDACGAAIGDNLITVNLRYVREQVMRLPAILEASVQRDFDGRLTINAKQRVPIAWVKCAHHHCVPKSPTQSLLVDAEGIAIPAEVVLSEFDALPVIDDETIDQITPGCAITSPRFVACMQLLKELTARQEKGGDKLLTIAVPMPGKFALDAYFANGAQVTFSYDDLAPQLLRYDRFAAEARQKKWSIHTLNLVAEHNVPVTFRVIQTATTPAPAAIPVTNQVADAAPAARPSINRSSHSATSGKSSRKFTAH